jgi:hypothetical protein
VGEGHPGRGHQARVTDTVGDTALSRGYFENGEAYQRFMGSRAAGSMFLDWIAPPERAHWLDIGCGTGVFR